MIKEKFSKIFKKLFKNYYKKKIFMMGNSHLINTRNKYKEFNNLEESDFKIFSQNGEDGIIDYLLFSLKILKPKFVEIGVGDYSESNTKFIFDRTSSEGLIIDIIEDFEEKVKKNTKIWRGNLTIVKRKINSDNILSTLEEFNFFKDIDLFSLDIDSIDYWVLEKLPKKFCKIIVVEYNPYFGSELKISVPNIKNFDRSKYHYSNLCFGASLKSYTELMTDKEFTFLGTNLFRNNAFFVNNDFIDMLSIKIPDTQNLKRFTDAQFRESRNQNNRLNLIPPKDILKEIKDCEVVDLKYDRNKIIKIIDLIN